MRLSVEYGAVGSTGGGRGTARARRFWLIVVWALSLIATTLPGSLAAAASPTAPQLRGPADGSTAPTAEIALSATATDPDGGSLDVRFEGRRLGATVPGGGAAGQPFTLVALPDTQNYTYANRQDTIRQQAQWAVDTRSQLNTAMVVHLGDLVSNYDNLTQWGHVSTGLRVLDDAALPNTVAAGNHDFDNATGAFGQYDTFFPPSRYASAAWLPSSARYGGYLGQNLFGPDPVDRRNMNNFALFSAGGRDFVVLNLEWEAPRYALDWATKVLAAHPDRIAIMATHSFVGLNGQRRTVPERPGGTSANAIWNDFVSQQCGIRLVLNGHFHNGEVGEANRSDLNRCGQPVQQILTDYQDRANGGDGWLRYYTFDPAANTVRATTYSPKLDRFETDADSAFTLPFDLTAPQPAPFTPVGTARISSGGIAEATWTGLTPDTWYEWRAVADDGQDTATSAVWTVRTPPSADLVDDTFTRTVTNGWGAADNGQAWQTTSTATSYSVGGGTGRAVVPPGGGRGGTLPGTSAADVRITADLSLSPVASGSGTYVSALGRVNGGSSYRAKLRFLPGGGLTLAVTRLSGGETTLSTATLSGVTVAAGQPVRLRFELSGTAPTTLRANAWPLNQNEPAGWTLTSTDGAAALQGPGAVGLDLYASSSAASASTVAVDRFTATRLGAAPPANQAPTAVIGTPVVSGRSVSLSGAGSSDPDGTITAWRWDFGDGTTGTGATASHTYAADGSYPVTLTVTDDDQATGTATRTVTVAAPPPAGGLAADTFERAVSAGWGPADAGGAWTVSGQTSRYSVSGGTGRQALVTPGTTAESALTGVTSNATDLRVSLAWSRTAAGGTLYASVVPRRLTASNDYRCKIVVSAAGAIQLVGVRRVNGAETSIGSATVAGLTHAANQPYLVACRAVPVGAGTQLTAKLWRAGTSEPAGWQLTASDSTPALQGAGGLGVSSYVSSSAASGVTLSVDNLSATRP